MIEEKEKINKDNPFQNILEYIIDGKRVGFLKYSYIYDRIEIDDLLVEEEYRNQGIWKKLMARLISIAIEKRVINITLEVRKSNDIAIKLYEKHGFRYVAVRKNYYGSEDGLLMEKQVM